MNRASRAATLAVLVLVGACSKDKDVEPPAELVDFKSTLDVRRAWNASLGGTDPVLRLALVPALYDGRVYAAGGDGKVYAFDAETGRSLWRTEVKVAITGGVGAGAGVVAVGSNDGDVVVLDAAAGTEKWRVRVNGEVLSPPAIGTDTVVVRTVDGRVRGLRLADGGERWSYDQEVPRLSLRGSAPPVVVGDTVVSGFDNGRVAAVALDTGDVLWETLLSPGRGRTEIERLVDIDSSVLVDGREVFAVGFQGRAAMLAFDSGQTWWARDFSSYRGVAVGGDQVFIATDDGAVVALDRRSGTERWRQSALARRGLSSPAVAGTTVVVGDFQGHVHWLDAASGEFLARQSTDGERIVAAPLVSGDLVFVQTTAGKLFALRAAPRG